MKIRELYLKNFGKFSEKKIVLEDGINLFCGENESGKTTIHTFIKSMLFGMERARGRAAGHDVFSLYEPWDQPNYYAGTMRFESGGKNFCLSRNFDRYSRSTSLICEDDGEEFSTDHGDLEIILNGLHAANYENTISIGQMKIETNQSLAGELQNYATNYYSTGNSDIDLDGAITRLQKQKRDAEKSLREHLNEKQHNKAVVEQEKNFVWREIHNYEQELEKLEEQIDLQKSSLNHLESQEMKKWRVHPGEILGVLVLILLVVAFIEKPFNYLLAIVLFLGEGLFVWNRLKDGKRKSHEQVLEEARSEMQKQLGSKEQIQSALKEKQVHYSNLQEQLEELDEVDSFYQSKEQEKRALEMASDKLLELSEGVQQELSMRLNEKASEILREITGGVYTMLLIDDKLKMSLIKNGRKILLEQVSRGTIEQIYFSLRMAAAELLFEEDYPLILDETFVYYDDVRLENTLRWLKKSQKQVILFSCQKREQEILGRI